MSPEPEGTAAPRSGHVLVVEDDVDAAAVLADYLTRAGFTADVAHGVDEALAIAGARHPDALVTDIRLRGGGDGLELAAALAELEPRPLLIAVSGYITPEERERARAVGIRQTLPKPFDPEVLVTRLRALLEDRAPG